MFWERRDYERLKVKSNEAVVSIGEEILKDVKCENISMGGMCLSVKRLPENRDSGKIFLEKKLKGEKVAFSSPFLKLWESMQEDEYLMGIRFKDTDSLNYGNLLKLVVELRNK